MASIHQRKGKGNWLAAYSVPQPDGTLKRVLRSTGTTDRSLALSFALACERAAQAAKAKRFSTAHAQRLLAELALLSGSDAAHAEPVEAYLRRWLREVEARSSNSTLSSYSVVCKRFLAFLGGSAHAPLSSVSPGVVSGFKSSLIGLGMSPPTIRQHLGTLRMAFQEGVTLGAWVRNPAEGITVDVGARVSPRKPFTVEQFRRMLEIAPTAEWRLYLQVLAYTGARQQEAAGLRWEQVGEDRLTLARSKNRDEHVVPLHPTLKQALQVARQENGVVFPTFARCSEARMARLFREAFLIPMGLVEPHRENTGTLGRVAAPYSLHSFRHSLATWLAEAGVAERERMLLIGHADKRVNRGYTHSEFAALSACLSRLP